MNLVLDTNVPIAAFLAKGFCHTLVEQCLRVHFVITSEFILNELREKLIEKFKFSNEDAAAVEALLRSRMQIVDPTTLKSNVCRDPDDDMILATALTGEAVCIITGDKDLLTLKKFGAIDILSPSEFEAYEELSGADLE
ncbi:putative toxin-antitoxin system toxin component, PIN family [Phormidesmis priestleyi ULC007]|uniref:Putative toxin-antitoxin system toxin component, PIN family n=1 Tax=Phormidesmis priestleyi ULC007 TaxID=1920490 RepID=A0A2T1DE44_9CYAN|nr:putative toxin-antitoxin system toxin component, PIN family [Phormidesmis priestleyi]PSB18734.1 putative toxin-antitoxin system toxin component, PIN family [Phormidesmis priestleyi ULC007]PZO51506.1 MAG: putative toxin-antitoxin system toxin component, PIN family [Phormidesmis priestleyi]